LNLESIKFCNNCGTHIFKFLSNNDTQSSLEKVLPGRNVIQDNEVVEQENLTTESRQDYTTIHNLGIKTRRGY
jgi:hypothetical protein